MIVKELPRPNEEGCFTVQILEEFTYNGKTFHLTKDEEIPARLIDFQPVENGYEVSFDKSYLRDMEWAARAKGFSTYIHPKFSF